MKIAIDRKPLKKAAKNVLKKHYWLFVVGCIFAAILGAGASDGFSIISARTPSVESSGDVVTSTPSLNASGMIDAIIRDQLGTYEKEAQAAEDSNVKNGLDVLGLFRLESSRGTLSAIVNKISSGNLYVAIYSGILNMTHSAGFTRIVFIIIALLIYIAFFVFISNVYKAVILRIFLESRTYSHVPVSRFMFLFRVKRYIKAVLTMFLVFLFQTLWDLTIIGGIIKHYSYIQVPFIVAENPNISPLEAITLSRRMMNGHKWERFVLDLSFIPWDLLNALTFGLLGIFFLDPYFTATTTEYYAALRAGFKKQKEEGSELLNDTYLFEHPSNEMIRETYSDLISLSMAPEYRPYLSENKVKQFFAKWFGIVLSYNNDEDMAYRASQIRKHQLEHLNKVQAGEMYPERLFTISEKEKRENVADLGPNRCYSISSLILLFFSFSLVGWLWEVSLHLVLDGTFVNRGTMHGPWLPIYGSGCLMIIVLLRKLRTIPWLEFIAAIVLCGIVEYFTHWYLEISRGAKWWDYSGYLLNLNGRICAEGLLIFGLGGMAVVYLLAPFLDNIYRKIKTRTLIIICAVLIAVFAADCVYSSKHPNKGKGITDYGEGNFLHYEQMPFSSEGSSM